MEQSEFEKILRSNDHWKEKLNTEDIDLIPLKVTEAQANKIPIEQIPVSKTEWLVGVKREDGGWVTEIPGQIKKGDEGIYYKAWFGIDKNKWSLPLNIFYHLDIMNRSLEIREKEKKDVTEIELREDEEAYVLSFKILPIGAKTLLDVYQYGVRVFYWVNNQGHKYQDVVTNSYMEQLEVLNPYILFDIPELVLKLKNEIDFNKKGRLLEELICKMFETINGFKVNSRVKSPSEEIDIVIENNSTESPWNKESNRILIECKNWSTNCGSKHLRDFAGKLENRRGRCKTGFFISWNGFTEGYRFELARYSKTEFLLIPVTGEQLEFAIQESNIEKHLVEWYNKALFDKN